MNEVTIPCRVGTKIGYIYYRETTEGKKEWRFREGKITRINVGKKAVTAKIDFLMSTYDVEELKWNTEFMDKTSRIIVTQEPFILTDGAKEKAVRWVEGVNKNPDLVKGIWE